MVTGDRRKGGERRRTTRDAAGPRWLDRDRRFGERRRRDAAGDFVQRRQFRRPQRILIVDDEPDVRAVWSEWLTMWRFTVIEAENGSIALERVRERRPDVVIMDVTMPVLDGFGATERLKGDPSTERLPVLLLSADHTSTAAERAQRVGSDVFLSKPIRARALLEEIRRAFRRLAAERSELGHV
jgi:CheY-like chemotaxis protein